MTGLYWTAAILALLAAAHAAVRLWRDRSLIVVTSFVCMLALGVALMLIAMTPALVEAHSGPPDVTFIAGALGLLGAWELLGMLAVVTGEPERPGRIMTIPVLGAVSAGLLELALEHMVRSAVGVHPPSRLPVVAAQLVMATYCCPALGRSAVLAWRCARRIPVLYIDVGMRAVSVAAVAELAVTVARASEITAAMSGMPATGQETAGVYAAQGIALIVIIAGVTVTAWFPAVASGMFQARMWTEWWRLRPLWADLVRAFPDIRLPPQPGTRLNARYRLHRRVIEIRDAELALRPHLDEQIAGAAADAARSAGLPRERWGAVIEAAGIASALHARQEGTLSHPNGTASDPVTPTPRNDLDAEAVRLLLVSREIRHSPIVRRLAARPPALGEQPG